MPESLRSHTCQSGIEPMSQADRQPHDAGRVPCLSDRAGREPRAGRRNCRAVGELQPARGMTSASISCHLGNKLVCRPCRPRTDDIAVRNPKGNLRRPVVIVNCGRGPDRAMEAGEAGEVRLVVEVLSLRPWRSIASAGLRNNRQDSGRRCAVNIPRGVTVTGSVASFPCPPPRIFR